uniref:Uncharacterized sensor-like histidine kinase ycf26 n=1 Tax=Gayliella sp. TaxID=2575623 RepID=A0A4D6WYK4_9FLOR|nr:Drug sensory protein A [Gayliella sp.]
MRINFKSIFKFHLQLRLIVLIVLLVSLLISICTFCFFTVLKKDSLIISNRFCKDLATLFAYNILNAVDSKSDQQLASLIEEIYISTASIRYILFFNVDGSLFFSLPLYQNSIEDMLQIHQNLFQLETQNFLFNIPFLQYNFLLHDHITNIVLPLNKNGINFGSLNLGISSNPILGSIPISISDISIIIFTFIWLFIIILSLLNFIIIFNPLNDLLSAMKHIASGDFMYRVSMNNQSNWNDLGTMFNYMAERLYYYDQKNINQLLLEKNKLESIASIISDGVILLDLELRLLFVNYTARKCFNCCSTDVIGEYITSLLPLHIVEVLLPILNRLVHLTYFDSLSCNNKQIYTDIHYDSQKTFRFLLTTTTDNTSQILTGIVIIISDISREVKLNKAKNQFISNVSHELRTPLCNIGSFLETLLDYNDSFNDKQKTHFLTIANNETQRLSRLVNDILDLARLESNFKYDLSQMNIKYLLNYILNTSQIIANKHNIKLILEIQPDICYVQGHESSFIQVMSNLLSNSIKFTNDGGQIVMRVFSISSLPINMNFIKNKHVVNLIRVEIIDEGIGIDIREQKIIFDRFVRIEDNIHTLQGTGLGLSIVKNILIKYDTDVVLNSHLLVGTSLWFDLLQF